MHKKQFPSKILLFGEYTVLDGSRALAFPYDQLYGQLSTEGIYQQELKDLYEFLDQKLPAPARSKFDESLMQEDIALGMGFLGNIPVGYGLGSSGTVAAALYDAYFDDEGATFDDIKNTLATIESYYHGKSSGLDPIVSYTQSPIITSRKEGTHPVEGEYDDMLSHFMLYDSEQARSTQTYVEKFHKMKEERAFMEEYPDLIKLNEQLIDRFLNKEDIASDMVQLSQLQYRLMQPMISQHIKPIWEEGLKSNSYSMKLCGAGGGGFFLLYMHDTCTAKDLLNNDLLRSTT